MWISEHASKPKPWLAGGACLALLMAGSSPAKADNIDNELRNKALVIMKDLEAHGYKNVGVLKFQVKMGNTPPTLTAGKLNYVMATRLENALVMSDKADAPIGLTRGASAEAAAKDKNATYLTSEGRKDLFKHPYPLAWGSQNVEVDAFLTGIVDIAPDMRKTKVTLRAFDKKNPDLRDVLSFTVDTDLAILRDTNQNFVVARRSFNSWANADDPDEEINKIAVKEAAKDNQPGASRKIVVDDLKDYLDFQILFDGRPVGITPDGFVDTPATGQTVLIKLTAKVKLGLLLRVNGVNTLNEQRDEKPDLRAYNWWVLDAGTEYPIKGFYKDGEVRKFEARADADVDIGRELGENAQRHGKIEFDVFVDPAALAKKVPKSTYTFRTVTTRAATFAELKAQIRQNLPVQKTALARTVIVGGSTENQTLKKTTFDGRHVGGLTINYR